MKKQESINPLNGKTYRVPHIIDDKINIDKFVEKNGKSVIAVQGLGFVGAVMSLVCANAYDGDYAVIGVDLPRKDTFWKIKSINEGLFPVVASDPKIKDFYNLAKKKGNLFATYDSYAYTKADIIIVDINLDVDKQSDLYGELNDYDVDLSSFRKAIKVIGDNCKEDVLILIETTVPPGTSKKVVCPIIKDCLTKRGLSTEKFKLGHSYERVMPGPNYIDSIQNFYRVYSGVNSKSADATEKFLKTIISTKEYPLTRLGNTNATEMAKVLENSYRAMNIAFAVEWSRFAEESEVNLYEVIDAIRMRPTHKNLMYPGIGVGGYCLTKDPLLASWSRQNLFKAEDDLGQSVKGVKINDKMPLFAYNFLKKEIKDINKKKILLLGVSYRSDVGDTRYSPVEPLYILLKDGGSNIKLHDPYITFWEEQNCKVENDFDSLIKNNYDLIIVSTGHSFYSNDETFSKIMNLDPLQIYDTIGLFDKEQIKELVGKHNLSVLGRGDI